MYRTKVLFGILSCAASVLYLGFGLLALSGNSLSTFDRLMPFALCATHLLASCFLFVTAYREFRREQQRLLAILHKLLREQASFSAQDLADRAQISLAEAQEFITKPTVQQEVVALGRIENVVLRALNRHSLN